MHALTGRRTYGSAAEVVMLENKVVGRTEVVHTDQPSLAVQQAPGRMGKGVRFNVTSSNRRQHAIEEMRLRKRNPRHKITYTHHWDQEHGSGSYQMQSTLDAVAIRVARRWQRCTLCRLREVQASSARHNEGRETHGLHQNISGRRCTRTVRSGKGKDSPLRTLS